MVKNLPCGIYDEPQQDNVDPWILEKGHDLCRGDLYTVF